MKKPSRDTPRVHLQALYAVAGALASGTSGPNPAVAALLAQAERIVIEVPDWWTTVPEHPPRRDALARVLALVPRDVLRSMTATGLWAITAAGEA